MSADFSRDLAATSATFGIPAEQVPLAIPWIYLAGPLFTEGEIEFNAQLAATLRSQGYRVYLPQQACAGTADPAELYRRCIVGLDQAGLVLAILDGTDADSGTCFELGYAKARGIPCIGLRTDFRATGEHLGLNLMLTHSCDRLILRVLNPASNLDDLVGTQIPITTFDLETTAASVVTQVLANYPLATLTQTAQDQLID